MEELAAYASGRTIADRPSSTPLDPRPSNAPLDSVSPVDHIAHEQNVATDYHASNSNASEASDSDELDDSGDEDYTPDSQVCSNDDEPLTAESEGSGAEDAEDIGIYLMDHDLQHAVSSIIQTDECDNRCVEGKAKELESLLCSVSTMNREEKQISIYTLLGTLMQVPVDRARGYGLRDKFNYYLPFVGKVCRPTFARCYGVTPLTVQRYKKHVRGGNIGVKSHGNQLNKNAAVVDVVWLVKWFKEFAEEIGEVVPVRVRIQKTKDGVVKRYYSSEMYTLLPAHFTWSTIYEEMHAYVEQISLRVREPAQSTMRKLLSLHCPTIRIRSPRSNVCDVCSIYHASMRNDVTSEKAEALGRHTESARRMR
eukprot:jgi/Phyca11/96482/e_gw1.1.456.1